MKVNSMTYNNTVLDTMLIRRVYNLKPVCSFVVTLTLKRHASILLMNLSRAMHSESDQLSEIISAHTNRFTSTEHAKIPCSSEPRTALSDTDKMSTTYSVMHAKKIEYC